MKSDQIIHSLIVSNARTGDIRRKDSYVDQEEALRAYGEAEFEYLRNKEGIQVMLLGADSLDTLMVTHFDVLNAPSWDEVTEEIEERLATA